MQTALSIFQKHPHRPGTPDRFRQIALMWLVSYPIITTLLLATGPLLEGAPLYVRTFAASLIMIPLMILYVQPMVMKRFGAWIRHERQGAQRTHASADDIAACF